MQFKNLMVYKSCILEMEEKLNEYEKIGLDVLSIRNKISNYQKDLEERLGYAVDDDEIELYY